jgi:hypothetical protein
VETTRPTAQANDNGVVSAYDGRDEHTPERRTATPSAVQEPHMDPANAAPAAHGPSSDELSARDREVLDFERQWWKYAGAKEQAVREKFDMSSTRYYQVLNALIDRPAALAHDPLLVRRLRRLRAARQRARSARRLGFEV